ncbi:MAG: hypothetical protein LBK95_19100 [Bifidobacteriaceae bacterium]|jgi:hypothetical protein|nr:hypothetical protein [Bifidobacteriaceae bacterium]
MTNSQAISVRLPGAVLDQLRRQAKAQGSTVSHLVITASDEFLKSRETPGIHFVDGPSGRRPRVVGGIDVWEIIAAFRGLEEPDEQAAIREVAVGTGQPEAHVHIALDYYAHHREEIDEWIDENERAAAAAEQQWRARQAVLA